MKTEPSKPVLEIRKLNFAFPHHQDLVLKNISLTLDEGDFAVVIGPNGSGKSTFLKTVHATFPSAYKQVFLNQMSYEQISPSNLSRSIVSLSQKSADTLFLELSVLENCYMYEERYRPSWMRWLGSSHLETEYREYLAPFHPNLPEYLHQPVKKLSGGESQCLAMALCLKFPFDLLLLDEHTSALSPKSSDDLMNTLASYVRQHKKTVMMITHNLAHALQYGNRLLVLREGEIVEDLRDGAKSSLTTQDLLKFLA